MRRPCVLWDFALHARLQTFRSANFCSWLILLVTLVVETLEETDQRINVKNFAGMKKLFDKGDLDTNGPRPVFVDGGRHCP